MESKKVKSELPLNVWFLWDNEGLVPEPANQFVVQATPSDDIVITFGYADTFINYSRDAAEDPLEHFSKNGIPTQGKARLVLTKKTALALYDVLGTMIGDVAK